MPTFTIFTALISVLSISYAVYYLRKSQNKKKQLKLRVIKGRRNILGIKISQIEKAINTDKEISYIDSNTIRKEIETCQKLFLTQNKGLQILAEITQITNLKENLLEKYLGDLRKEHAKKNIKNKSLKKDTFKDNSERNSKTMSLAKQRKTIEEELLKKIKTLNKSK